MHEAHVVLSTQALAILQELKPLTGHSRYVFASIRTITRSSASSSTRPATRCAQPPTEPSTWPSRGR